MMVVVMMMMMNFNVGRMQTECFRSCPHHIKIIAGLILMFLSVCLSVQVYRRFSIMLTMLPVNIGAALESVCIL